MEATVGLKNAAEHSEKNNTCERVLG